MFGKKRHLIFFFALALASVPAAGQNAPLPIAPSASAPTLVAAPVTLRVGEHDDYDRVVFDWPRNVSYKVSRDGGHVTISFGAPGSVSLKPAAKLSRAHDFASAADGNGNLSVSFTVDGKAGLKDFYSGTSIVLDVGGPARAPEPVKTVEKEKPKPKPVVEKAVSAPTPPPEAKPAEPAAAPVAAAAKDASQSDASAAVPASAGNAKSGRDASAMNIGTKPVLVASLDPHAFTRAAVWARAGYGYIVFDKKLTLTPEALAAGLQAPTVNLQPLDLPNASGFRFTVPDKVSIQASRDGTIWKLFLTKQQPDVPVSSTLVAQPDFALGARFMLPLPDAPEPVRMTDPVVGDDLIVVPLNQTHAFSIMRRMADFQIWPAAQGLVIKPLTDKVIVRTLSDGVEVTADAGLHLSPAADTGEAQQSAQKARSVASGKSLFDFAAWRGKPNETFTQVRQRLQQTIVDVPDRERNRARLELARFYFARGYGVECLALLNYLTKDVPDLAAHSDFLALSGAAKILANHPDDGLKDLDAANMPDVSEIKLWQAVANAEIGNWTDAEEKFAASENLLTGYPEPFFSRFFVLAIESALAVGNDHEAADWLNAIQSDQHDSEIDPAIDYLHGVLHAKTGQAQAAATAWKLAAGSKDRLYKVRAEMALIDLGVANLSLSPAQAADRLEALRFAWRGDDLEVDILHRLGLFYIKAKNIKAGLNILGQAIQLYPHSPLVPKIHDEMTQTFHDVFLGDLGKNLSPLETLAVYQQYRDTLIPTGDEGVAVTRNLAERLAAIDLMDQAGDLLEDIAKNKLKGEERGKVVVRLAALRLLDHKPEAALAALDIGSADTISAGLQQERELLHARALSQLHRDDEALAVLKDDNHYPAKILRADINMSAKHWDDAAKNLLDLVGPPPKAGENLSNDQAEWLVRCAVALAMKDDQVGLDRLAIDYGAAMAGTPQNNTFRILVEPEKPGQLRDIAAAQGRISEVDMFQGFLDQYRKSEEPAKTP